MKHCLSKPLLASVCVRLSYINNSLPGLFILQGRKAWSIWQLKNNMTNIYLTLQKSWTRQGRVNIVKNTGLYVKRPNFGHIYELKLDLKNLSLKRNFNSSLIRSFQSSQTFFQIGSYLRNCFCDLFQNCNTINKIGGAKIFVLLYFLYCMSPQDLGL